MSYIAKAQIRTNYYVRPVVEAFADVLDGDNLQIIILFHNPTFRDIRLTKYQYYFDRRSRGAKLRNTGKAINVVSKNRTFGEDALLFYTGYFNPAEVDLLPGKHVLRVKIWSDKGLFYVSPPDMFELPQRSVSIGL